MKRVLLPLLFFLNAFGASATVQPGAALPPLAGLKDQNQKPVVIAPDTRIVFFASEMSGSRVMTKALQALPASALKEKQAVYIADISEMPAIFTTIVALPRLQKSRYPVGLIRDARDGASLPRKPGMVTVLHLDAGKVSSVDFVRDAQQIRRHLQ